MERGIGVHCQKPLTATVWEARLLANAARKYKVATQMGNQGYSSVATRIACEYIWNDEIGDITEVHSWNGGGFSRGIVQWPPPEPVPATLDWNLWQGRSQEHTYSSKIHPVNWRGFLDYGTMMIGDWGIHQLGPANWALGLGETCPTSVECIAVTGVNPVTYPNYACKIQFPERPSKYVKSGKMPPVAVYWYEGSMAKMFKPPQGLTQEDIRGVNEIFVGTKGYLGTSDRGESYTLLPRSKQAGHPRPPEVLKRSPGHFQDWIRACKGGEPACSNFTIAGPYTEWMLLGAISWRFPHEKLLWDGKNLRFTNNEKANEFVKPNFRKGWELQDISGLTREANPRFPATKDPERTGVCSQYRQSLAAYRRGGDSRCGRPSRYRCGCSAWEARPWRNRHRPRATSRVGAAASASPSARPRATSRT